VYSVNFKKVYLNNNLYYIWTSFKVDLEFLIYTASVISQIETNTAGVPSITVNGEKNINTSILFTYIKKTKQK
jgi:hypothetical protein